VRPPTKEVTMAFSEDLVGCDVYARDGARVGQVERLLYGGGYVLVRRTFLTDLVVPLGALERSGGRLTILHTSSDLDDAPHVDPAHELTPRDEALLDDFYMPRAA
jgi:hypothetical protein